MGYGYNESSSEKLNRLSASLRNQTLARIAKAVAKLENIHDHANRLVVNYERDGLNNNHDHVLRLASAIDHDTRGILQPKPTKHPMDTAPKDGREIVVFARYQNTSPHRLMIVAWGEDFPGGPRYWRMSAPGVVYEAVDPQWWCPLPDVGDEV